MAFIGSSNTTVADGGGGRRSAPTPRYQAPAPPPRTNTAYYERLREDARRRAAQQAAAAEQARAIAAAQARAAAQAAEQRRAAQAAATARQAKLIADAQARARQNQLTAANSKVTYQPYNPTFAGADNRSSWGVNKQWANEQPNKPTFSFAYNLPTQSAASPQAYNDFIQQNPDKAPTGVGLYQATANFLRGDPNKPFISMEYGPARYPFTSNVPPMGAQWTPPVEPQAGAYVDPRTTAGQNPPTYTEYSSGRYSTPATTPYSFESWDPRKRDSFATPLPPLGQSTDHGWNFEPFGNRRDEYGNLVPYGPLNEYWEFTDLPYDYGYGDGGWGYGDGGWGYGGGGGYTQEASAPFYRGSYTQNKSRWNETLLTWGLRQE